MLLQYKAQWISFIYVEPIIGTIEKDPVLEYGIRKNWLFSAYDGRYFQYYFTQKGAKEILQYLKEKTCITGRIMR